MSNRSCFSVSDKNPLIIAFTLTFFMMLVEVAGGLFSGSLALLSDAGHMLTDTAALFICLLAAVFAGFPATKEKTYGFHRLEILSALLNGMLLTLISAYIFYQAVLRMVHPGEVQGGLMLLVAFVGLIVNATVAVILQKGSTSSINVKAAFFHVLSDALSSVGVIIGGLVILTTGWSRIDPILGFLIGFLILRGAYSLVLESVNILLESVPKGINIGDVISEIKMIGGVIDVHDVHIWAISSGNLSFSAHIKVGDIPISGTDMLIKRINGALNEKFCITHTTLQFECDACSEHGH